MDDEILTILFAVLFQYYIHIYYNTIPNIFKDKQIQTKKIFMYRSMNDRVNTKR